MSDITEGLGGAVEGGLLARAVEPKTREAAHAEASLGDCLNCGAQLTGTYCQSCGQKGDVHRSLLAIGHEIMHGVLHLDGKIWRTLPLLALKPGQLTRRYVDGERARFVSPMAMFLFSVFAMFAVFQIVGLSAPSDLRPSAETAANIEQASEAVRNETARTRAQLEQRLEELPQDSPLRSEVETDLANLDTAETIIGGTENVVLGTNDTAPDTLKIGPSNIEWLESGLFKKWRENPSLMLYKLQANAYKFSWLLIPLSLPFVWLVFAWKRRFKAYDHAIFVTYSIAFMSLLFIALSILAALGVGGGWVFAALGLIPPIHIYKQLRGTYQLSRFSALWRLAFLLVSIFVIILLFLQALLLLGAF